MERFSIGLERLTTTAKFCSDAVGGSDGIKGRRSDAKESATAKKPAPMKTGRIPTRRGIPKPF
jgi:hypothetical protein